jgi:biopolymer transport protein ExbD
MVVRDPSEFVLQKMSAYDLMKNRLMKVKERFREMQPEDFDDIIIAAENEVLYDKIVQIMDAARAAEYPNISIAKLRS